jgi:alkanesulfonate monooxygenase SsuD/methylene tetrahydromethanopterin reductase-like flavin-dependent oxidoreductase (luciferase family)
MADSLDEMSDGRFILGLGAGWHEPEYTAFGFPFDHRAGRFFEEALQIILPLLKEGHVDFAGQYYQARDCVLRPRGPSRGGPPIWIGATRPRMLNLVEQHADAWGTEQVQTLRTKKVPRNHVKAAATDKHPAQVEVYYEDITVGTWRTTKFSGALLAKRVNELAARVKTLQEAVKFARETANSSEAKEVKTGEAIFNYIFED